MNHSTTPSLITLTFAALISACHGKPPTDPPPVPVVTYTVHPTADGTARPYPAEVAPRYSNPLAFRVAGKIIERKVRLGDRVTAGEMLARLDPVDQERRVASARAALDAAEHRLTFAKEQLTRDQAQYAHQLIATNQLEQTEDAEAAAQGARDEAVAELTIAENALRYHTLTADHEGVITREAADTGQVVTAGEAVYELAWAGDVDVVVDVAASDASRAKIGELAQVSLPSSPDPLTARVREIAPAADPQTRTLRIRLQLDAPPPGLKLGTLGEVTLLPTTAAPAGIDIPATALFHHGTVPAVWVLQGTSPVLALRPVTVQGYRDETVRLSAGLNPGERIVAAGVHTVFAGERVTPFVASFGESAP